MKQKRLWALLLAALLALSGCGGKNGEEQEDGGDIRSDALPADRKSVV